MDPQDLRYAREHEWPGAEGDQVTVGITDYAQVRQAAVHGILRIQRARNVAAALRRIARGAHSAR